MKIITALFCLISFLGFSQEREIQIDRRSIGPVTVEHSIKTYPDEVDTFEFVIMTYQDERFEILIQCESIMFTKGFQLQEFIDDLKAALASMANKSDILTWRKKEYVIEKTDWSRKLFIRGKKSSYFSINKSNTIRLIEWLEDNKF